MTGKTENAPDVVKLAKVLNGPHDPQGFYADRPEYLAQLRDIRWEHLSTQKQGEMQTMARAAIRELVPHSRNADYGTCFECDAALPASLICGACNPECGGTGKAVKE